MSKPTSCDRLWGARPYWRGPPSATLPRGLEWDFGGVAVSDDGSLVAAVEVGWESEPAGFSLWGGQTGSPVSGLGPLYAGAEARLAFTPGGRALMVMGAAVSSDGTWTPAGARRSVTRRVGGTSGACPPTRPGRSW